MLAAVAFVVHNTLRIKRFLHRIAKGPRTALIKPLDGLPIRIDVINTKCDSDRRRTRNVYSCRNIVSLIVKRFIAKTSKRREFLWKLITEQPISPSLLYVLTYRGGLQALTRTPDTESMHFAERQSKGVVGVRKKHVISAFAGNHDVTRLVKNIETSSCFGNLGFIEIKHYLWLRGFKEEFGVITILFTDMNKVELVTS